MEKMSDFIEEIKNFRLCSMSADPDEQTCVVYTYKELSKRFINYLKKQKIDDKNINDKINNIFTDIERMCEVYDLKIDLECLIDDLEEWACKDMYYINSKDREELLEIILETLKDEKAHTLPLVCNKLGLEKGTEEEAFSSKKVYINKRLIPLDSKEILELARKINEIYDVDNLNNKILEITNKDGLNVFNTFENIKELIISEINKAEFLIWVAVAWITDCDLANLLFEKQKQGLNIQLIINDDEINKKLGKAGKLEDYFQVYKISSNKLMHNKFCIIDLKTVLHGSYNWTTKAKYNKETLGLINNRKEAEKFAKEFINLKN